jgi:archaellin
MFSIIDKPNLYCHYDHIKQLPIIIFRNVLTDELITEAHTWLYRISDIVKNENDIQGLIYDLQAIKRFKNINLDITSQPGDHSIDLSKLPVALVVSNVYQEHQMRERSSQEERKWLVNSYQEAFDFIQTFNTTARGITRLGIEDNSLILNTENASAWYDSDKHNFTATYYGAVTPIVTADVYRTIGAVFENYGTENVRGGIFDFRHISHFENANLNTVRRNSSSLNFNYDMSHIAVPLIVGTVMQERMVMVSLKITPQEERKRIVHNSEEALNFVEEFYAKRTSKTD